MISIFYQFPCWDLRESVKNSQNIRKCRIVSKRKALTEKRNALTVSCKKFIMVIKNLIKETSLYRTMVWVRERKTDDCREQ